MKPARLSPHRSAGRVLAWPALGLPALLAWVLTSSPALGQSILRVHEPVPGDGTGGYGLRAAFVGDADGDGVQDYGFTFFDGAWGVVLHSGASGAFLRSWTAPAVPDAIAPAGDVDGDGFADVAFTVSAHDASGGRTDAGAAFVYSGSDGSLLFSATGAAAFDGLRSVACVGDVDGDGTEDLAVGLPGYDGIAGGDAGRVTVYSMATQSVLYHVEGPALGGGFGREIAPLGDWDGDGVPDFAVASQGGGIFGLLPDSRGDVISGATQAMLATYPGSVPNGLGTAVANVGDVDGDGHDDLALGGPQESANLGRFEVRAGGSGALLLGVDGSHGQNLGFRISGGADANGDGTADFLVGAEFEDAFGIYPGSRFGRFHLYAGQSFQKLSSWRGEHDNDQFAHSLSGPVDVNGDGFADWLVGIASYPGQNPVTGRVEIWSGGRRFLSANQRVYVAGDPLELEARLGPTGKPASLYILAVNGIPFVFRLFGGTFGPGGDFTLPLVVPPGLEGLELTFVSFGFNEQNHLLATNTATIAIQ